MALGAVSHAATRPGHTATSAPVTRRPTPHCTAAMLVVASLLLWSAAAAAHWLQPEEIVAGLAHDAQLRASVGVLDVYRDPKLPRLLVIKVQRDRWEAAPTTMRIQLAEEWLATWRHNVPEGIVAVLDAGTAQSVVHFDTLGHARLRAVAPAVTPSPERAQQVPG